MPLITLFLPFVYCSGHEARNISNVTIAKSFSSYNKAEDGETINSVLSCCPECVTSFEREAKSLKGNHEKLLTAWLQCHDEDKSLHKVRFLNFKYTVK